MTRIPGWGSDGRAKYKNQATFVDGIRFASKKEADRWVVLHGLERAGIIQDLKRQVRFPIVVNRIKICTYICDFSYEEQGQRIIEDVKSQITANLPVYRLKKRLMLAVHGIEIQES